MVERPREMKNLLFKCEKCLRYTMDAKCPRCGEATRMAAPAKYSPDDKYARFRSPLAYQTTATQDSGQSEP